MAPESMFTGSISLSDKELQTQTIFEDNEPTKISCDALSVWLRQPRLQVEMVLRKSGGMRQSEACRVGKLCRKPKAAKVLSRYHRIKKGRAAFSAIQKGTNYWGQLNEAGKPHGLGRMTWNGSGIYEGMFVDGEREGFGRLISWDGTLYQGSFKNGLQQGEGQIRLS